MPLNPWDQNRVLTSSPDHPVIELVGIWQTAEGQDQKNIPCRGFGGQILFFAAGHKSPVKVKGQVSIYVFDDVGTPDDQSKPYHQYDFTSEQWDYFFRDSTLGSCYQVFVPYTRPGGFEADCSLRVKFTPDEGLPVYSKVATINIRGIKNNTEHTSEKLAQKSSSLVTQSQEQPLTKDQLLNTIVQAKNEQLQQQVIPTHTAESVMNQNLQQHRLHKLEQLLDTQDPDPARFEPKHEITHTRKKYGNTATNSLEINQPRSSAELQTKPPSAQLQEIFGEE
jgi:hypothetical protein